MMRAVPTVPRAAVAVGIALAMCLAGSEAWAQETPPSAGPLGPLSGFIPFLLIFVLFYFLLILPQQRQKKKHRATLEALKKNDKVATNGGIHGTVMSLSKDVVTLEIAPNVRIKIRRDAIADLRTGDDEESK